MSATASATAASAPNANAAAPPAAGQPEQKPVDAFSSRVDILNTQGGKILCVSDIRGAISTLNALAAEHNAVAIIHSGDFGFYEPSSLASISERTLRHLVQYSLLISPAFRARLLAPNVSSQQMRDLLKSPPSDVAPPPGNSPSSQPYFALSEFPRLLAGEIQLRVPVYTIWGACEDVAILEKIRVAAPSALSVRTDPAVSGATSADAPSQTPGYSIRNLTVLDEATTRVLVIGGIRLRLFGLGGAIVHHKLFDNGTGAATIAGGAGTMWTTMLQIGELVDTAQKVYDPTETRLLVTHASPGREGLISQLALVLKADLTVSASLHFRYGVSYNEFAVLHDPEAFRAKLEAAKRSFNEVWDTVKTQVEGVVDDNQRVLLENALAVANRVPAPPPANGGQAIEESAWKNTWNWNLPDAAFGSLILDIHEGRVSSEMKSQGFNYAYRANAGRAPPPDVAPSLGRKAPQSQPQKSMPISGAPHPRSAPSGPPNNVPPPHQGPSALRANAFPGINRTLSNGSRGSPAQHVRAPSGPGQQRGNASNGRFVSGPGWANKNPNAAVAGSDPSAIGSAAAGPESDKKEGDASSPAPRSVANASPTPGAAATTAASTSGAASSTPASAAIPEPGTIATESARVAATAATAEAAQAAVVPVPDGKDLESSSKPDGTSGPVEDSSSSKVDPMSRHGVCFNCGKMGHMRIHCPEPKRYDPRKPRKNDQQRRDSQQRDTRNAAPKDSSSTPNATDGASAPVNNATDNATPGATDSSPAAAATTTTAEASSSEAPVNGDASSTAAVSTPGGSTRGRGRGRGRGGRAGGASGRGGGEAGESGSRPGPRGHRNPAANTSGSGEGPNAGAGAGARGETGGESKTGGEGKTAPVASGGNAERGDASSASAAAASPAANEGGGRKAGSNGGGW